MPETEWNTLKRTQTVFHAVRKVHTVISFLHKFITCKRVLIRTIQHLHLIISNDLWIDTNDTLTHSLTHIAWKSELRGGGKRKREVSSEGWHSFVLYCVTKVYVLLCNFSHFAELMHDLHKNILFSTVQIRCPLNFTNA